jgi:hypothetical protein
MHQLALLPELDMASSALLCRRGFAPRVYPQFRWVATYC